MITRDDLYEFIRKNKEWLESLCLLHQSDALGLVPAGFQANILVSVCEICPRCIEIQAWESIRESAKKNHDRRLQA